MGVEGLSGGEEKRGEAELECREDCETALVFSDRKDVTT